MDVVVPWSYNRVSSSKRIQEYEKHRMSSCSPVSRRVAADSRMVSQRHAGLSSPSSSHARARHDNSPTGHYDSPPPKKKIIRDDGHLPPSHRPEKQYLPPERIAARKSIQFPPPYPSEVDREYSRPIRSHYPQHPDGYGLPAPRSKEIGHANMEAGYPKGSIEASRNRCRADEYSSGKNKHSGEYLPVKYSTPLTERFPSSTDSQRDGQRVQFSREDLENITIDIKRNLRNYSPTIRRIVNPAEVKLVRRATEGHRPLFDRQEIKRAPKNSNEDSYNEPKSYEPAERTRSAPIAFNYKNMENYEVTRNRFEGNRSSQFHSDNAHTLNDRWQKLENPAPRTMDRNESTQVYSNRHQSEGGFAENRRLTKARASPDRVYRLESRDEYPSASRKLLRANPTDLRHNLAIRRKDNAIHDAREKLLQRRANDRDHHPEPYLSASSGPMRARSGSDSPGYPSSNKRMRGQSPLPRPPSSEFVRAGESSQFAPRSNRYKYQFWNEKSTEAAKGSGYYEGRTDYYKESSNSKYGFRGMRTRGFRSRPFRGGPLRGSGFRGRGAFRNTTSPRGRGYPLHRRMSGSYKLD